MSITYAFEKTGKGAVRYSHQPHTKAEVRIATVRWVTQEQRPFSIVSDLGFRELMRTGRPSHYIPSPATVSRDVRQVFAIARGRIALMLKVSCYIIYVGAITYLNIPGTSWIFELRNGHMDFPKSQTFHGHHGPLSQRWSAQVSPAGHGRRPDVPHWPEFGYGIRACAARVSD